MAIAPGLSKVFSLLLCDCCFPKVWRCANVIPISKGALSALSDGYRPISITPVLSKVFERLIDARLSRYLELNRILPDFQYAYRKGRGTRDALRGICCRCQSALECGHEVLFGTYWFQCGF